MGVVEAEGLIAHDVLAVVLRMAPSSPEVLLWQRARVERLRQRAYALEVEAAERGLLEEN